jgi:hypothetical protein
VRARAMFMRACSHPEGYAGNLCVCVRACGEIYKRGARTSPSLLYRGGDTFAKRLVSERWVSADGPPSPPPSLSLSLSVSFFLLLVGVFASLSFSEPLFVRCSASRRDINADERIKIEKPRRCSIRFSVGVSLAQRRPGISA